MRSSFSAFALVISLAVGCGSVQSSGGQGGSGGSGSGGSATGGGGTGGQGMGGQGTGGQGTGGQGAGGAGPGGSGGHGGATGGDTGRGGAGGANGGPCWAATDCGATATCDPPGTPYCGCLGVARTCSRDTDCAPDAATPSICDFSSCPCSSGLVCVSGCTTNANCPEGDTCATNHHCVPTPCTSASGTCPTDFTCSGGTGGGGGTCARKACKMDSQCSGACVEGFCYGAPGTCRLPAA
jgi:hypothetical protein